MILGMSRRLAAVLLLLQALLVWLLCSGAGAAPRFKDSMAQRVLACTACHGDQGRAGPDGYYPRLAGKPAGYLHHQLLNFRDGRRHYGLMTRMLEPLSDAYLLEIAQHFAAQDAPYPPPAATLAAPATLLARGRQLALQGDAGKKLPACASCHGSALTGVLPATPGLLGLPRDYLSAQLGAWVHGQRRALASGDAGEADPALLAAAGGIEYGTPSSMTSADGLTTIGKRSANVSGASWLGRRR